MSKEIARIKNLVEKELLKKAHVLGVMTAFKETDGKKTDELAIVVLVEKKFPVNSLKVQDLIPPTIACIPTDVREVGIIRAPREITPDIVDRIRPAPMGTSGGHYLITAGTNGYLIKDKIEGKTCILTNNHVGANSNSALIGDPYLQPGAHDGGKLPVDQIGELLRFVPINFIGVPSTCPNAKIWSGLYNIPARIFGTKTRLKAVVEQVFNEVDCSLIEVNEKDVQPKILSIGTLNGISNAQIGMEVKKTGRTTDHTKGVVSAIDATINVNYGNSLAPFINQVVIDGKGFSAGGDSGSAIVDKNNFATGLLFAGGEDITIANHISKVLQELNAGLILD